MAIIHSLVEGSVDEAVASVLIIKSGHQPGQCYGKRGCAYICNKIKQFNMTANYTPYLAFIDLMDTNLPCPSEILSAYLPYRHPSMLFRVVVREIESWILADRINIARFLGVSIARIPLDPEKLPDPKRTLIEIARHSNRRQVINALVPNNNNNTAVVGPLYNAEVIRFVTNNWSPDEARLNAPSLDRCLVRLSELSTALNS